MRALLIQKDVKRVKEDLNNVLRLRALLIQKDVKLNRSEKVVTIV